MKVKLCGQNLALVFDGEGRIIQLKNKLTGEVYPVQDKGEYFVIDGKRMERCGTPEITCTDTCVSLKFDTFTVKYEVRLSYIEKTVTLTTHEVGVVEKVGVLNLTFPDATDIHYHDDCTIWHCPMCTYARHEKGGIYYGLAYPYWDSETEMVFSPYLPLTAGEEFISEKAFIGAFEKKGKIVSSHGPYPGKRKLRYHDGFDQAHSGLGQHFVGGKVPDDVGIPEEEQDEGEIRAMRQFFRDYLGEMPLPEDGYFVWQNGWWAGLNCADRAHVDVMNRIGVRDVMTAAMYFGHANHPSCQPNFITDVKFDPLRFPRVTDKKTRITTLADGHHHNETASEDTVTEYTEEFSAPADYDDMIRYGMEKGVHITSFSTPNNSYANYPEWLGRDENGDPYKYFGTTLSCPACKDFMDHHFEMLCEVIDTYSPRMFFFDGRWMSYREIACGYPSIGEDPCYSEGHGHLPGHSRYMEWKNIRDFKRRLRERYPEMCFEQYYGLKRGGTWALSYFNSDENYYEVANADDLRFQAWHNEMDRFRPTYMHFANIMAKTVEEFKYAMISAISTSSYCQLASAFHLLRESDEAVEFFKKWRGWASENAAYLRHKENLFGCPGDVKVDGSAHIIDGEGWVFLFDTVDTDETASLDLREIYGLDGTSYKASQVYPYVAEYTAKDGVIEVPVQAHNAVIVRLAKV
ncbi:MAG: hypothetical protein IJ386_05070 [Clostridia bacterium]|nr:hypothetical protein [Clostridia bacterium]